MLLFKQLHMKRGVVAGFSEYPLGIDKTAHLIDRYIRDDSL